MSGIPSVSESAAQNLFPNDPHLKDVLSQTKKDVLLSLCSHHIGTVQSFDPEDQTAVVTINYTKMFFQFNATTGAYTPVSLPYPTLVDCPVICLGGGDASLTFPIAPGDECLVIFNDRDMDNWFSGTNGLPPASGRLHSFSDAIILVGLRSLTNALTGYSSSNAVLQNGDASVAVTPTQVKIANVIDGSLGAAMTNLLTGLSVFLAATADATTAVEIAAAAAAFIAGPPTLAVTVAQIEGILA